MSYSLVGIFVFVRFFTIFFLGSLAWEAKANYVFVSNHATELLDPRFNYDIGHGELAMYVVVSSYSSPVIWPILTCMVS